MSVVAIADGPIVFTDINTGRLVTIPVNAITFDSGKINVDGNSWPDYLTYKSVVDPWLKYLAENGRVVAGKAAPPQPAIILKAVALGSSGNDISVEFSNITEVDPHDASKTTFDAMIREKHEYTGLQPSTVQTVLGTDSVPGSQPGLVVIPAADTPLLPKEGTYQLKAGSDMVAAKRDVNQKASGATVKAFTLQAYALGTSGNMIKATVLNVDETANTFTLRVEYQESITGIKLSDLPLKLAGASGKEFIITASPPPSNYAVPAPGVVKLSGGAESQNATKAAATVFTA